MDSTSSSDSTRHVVLLPFMSKGHTIPLLHLARLLLRRPHTSVTVITTPFNLPFISHFLSGTSASVVSLPFPSDVPDIPSGVESTDMLPSMSLFLPFVRATKLMQSDLERTLENIPRVTFMVSDGFLWWTVNSADKFGFPRLVFFGMSSYASSLTSEVGHSGLLLGPESDNELITLTRFPWIKITKDDFKFIFQDLDPMGPYFQFIIDTMTSSLKSYAKLINSFYDIESTYIDYSNNEPGPKSWCIGPLCLADQAHNQAQSEPKPKYIQWLRQKLEQGFPVLYVAFGTQATMSPQQLKEIAIGLEKSEVNFLWVIRNSESELGDGFEDRVGDRGIVVREWVDQKQILNHERVEGFLSHCGWNSILESICGGVPILAWPMVAEQPLNARMVVEEMKIGLRVETEDRLVGGFVKWEEIEKKVRELMEGERGKQVRKRVTEVAEMAVKAMEEKSGSSWRNLDLLIEEIADYNEKKTKLGVV